MADRVLAHRSIRVLWNASVTGFEGAGGALTHARVRTRAPAADGSGTLQDTEALLEARAACIPCPRHLHGVCTTSARHLHGICTAWALRALYVHSMYSLPPPLQVSAAFVSIGHDPNTALFEGQLALGAGGYLEPYASSRLRPCVVQAATFRARGCNPLLRPLQARAATST